MRNYQLSGPARKDIQAIARYSTAKWGIPQAREYAEALEACFNSIGENKVSARPLLERRPDLRFIRCNRHFVFFLQREGKKPLILAVLHEKMDLISRIQKRLDSTR